MLKALRERSIVLLWGGQALPKVFRLRMAVETGACLLLMSFSPALFRSFSPRAVLMAYGLGGPRGTCL